MRFKCLADRRIQVVKPDIGEIDIVDFNPEIRMQGACIQRTRHAKPTLNQKLDRPCRRPHGHVQCVTRTRSFESSTACTPFPRSARQSTGAILRVARRGEFTHISAQCPDVRTITQPVAKAFLLKGLGGGMVDLKEGPDGALYLATFGLPPGRISR